MGLSLSYGRSRIASLPDLLCSQATGSYLSMDADRNLVQSFAFPQKNTTILAMDEAYKFEQNKIMFNHKLKKFSIYISILKASMYIQVTNKKYSRPTPSITF